MPVFRCLIVLLSAGLILLSPKALLRAQDVSGGDSLLLHELQYHVKALAHDSMRGRLAGSREDSLTYDYIKNCFRKLKLKPWQEKRPAFTFTDENGKPAVARNLMYLHGKKDTPIIMVNAHYDHLGMGGKRSRSILRHEVHNGADDNASGVAVLLTLAKMFKGSEKLPVGIVFMALSAHEPGLFGAAHAAELEGIDSSRVKLLINLDMVGRMDENARVLWVGGDAAWLTALRECSTPGDSLILKNKDLSLGDPTVFSEEGIPVINLTTGMHDDYHKVSDDEALINYRGMLRITRLLFRFLNRHAMSD
jgi:hypothetical protein